MTVDFTDPSGKVLESKTEPLDFTASLDVVAISIGFGSVRNEERAFRNGAFLRGYTRSSKIGNAYSIVRDGGWPAAPQLYVDELPALSPGFGLLYAQDFSALPNQTLTPGANIIGGQRWWFKGAFTEADETWKIVAGTGMQTVQRTSTSSDSSPGALPACMMLDCADLDGYDAATPLLAQFRFETVDLTYPTNVFPVCTLVTAVGSAAAITNAERTGINGFLADKNAGTWRYTFSRLGSTGGWSATAHTGAANLAAFQLASTVALRTHLGGLDIVGSATAWPALDAAPAFVTDGYRSALPLGATPTPNQGLAFWAKNTVGPAFGLRTHALRALRVYQAGV